MISARARELRTDRCWLPNLPERTAKRTLVRLAKLTVVEVPVTLILAVSCTAGSAACVTALTRRHRFS